MLRSIYLLFVIAIFPNLFWSPTKASPGSNRTACLFSSPEFPAVIKRIDWDARSQKKTVSFDRPLEYIIVHHSATKTCTTGVECSELVLKIQVNDMSEKGLDDIAFNYLIGGKGQLYEGRGKDVVGQHTEGYNNVSIGVCLIGNFTTDSPSDEALATLRKMISCLEKEFTNQKELKVTAHRDLKQTTCPGNVLYEAMEQMPFYTNFSEDTSTPLIETVSSSTPYQGNGAGITTPGCTAIFLSVFFIAKHFL